jgi:hypothetical protein
VQLLEGRRGGFSGPPFGDSSRLVLEGICHVEDEVQAQDLVGQLLRFGMNLIDGAPLFGSLVSLLHVSPQRLSCRRPLCHLCPLLHIPVDLHTSSIILHNDPAQVFTDGNQRMGYLPRWASNTYSSGFAKPCTLSRFSGDGDCRGKLFGMALSLLNCGLWQS